MLGSVHDAEDALQETLIRAWRGVDGLKEGTSARSWLYAIATNVCLTELTRRGKRMLPHDFSPAVDGTTAPGVPIADSVWIEPYPDQAYGLPVGKSSPEASYEQHEAVELAFVAALQHLAANQRATLLLREVLGFSAQETADTLGTSVASVNSALQRARAAVSERVPERTQQTTLRALGDRALSELVERYVSAWERCDVPAFTALLAEDATFAMPPLQTWYAPRDQIAVWAHESPDERCLALAHAAHSCQRSAGARSLCVGRRGVGLPAVRAQHHDVARRAARRRHGLHRQGHRGTR